MLTGIVIPLFILPVCFTQVFIELAFHCIRQERYEDAIRWVSMVLELCPGIMEQLDEVLHSTTAVSTLPPSAGGLTDAQQSMVLKSLFYKGHLQPDKPDRGATAPSRAHTTRTDEEKKAAVRRAVLAASTNFVTPGPGHYNVDDGAVL